MHLLLDIWILFKERNDLYIMEISDLKNAIYIFRSDYVVLFCLADRLDFAKERKDMKRGVGN
jgi:hypothetical protein